GRGVDAVAKAEADEGCIREDLILSLRRIKDQLFVNTPVAGSWQSLKKQGSFFYKLKILLRSGG
ncbi:MAG: hypothetical protein LAT80_04780, partial [Balneolaceae bacterium]|nr:hypothetical protein [Balneolaceae bacterium]